MKVRMANKKIGEFEKFAKFVADDAEELSSPAGKARLNQTIKTQLERIKKQKSKSWILEAGAAKKEFNSKAQGLIEKLCAEYGSRAELLAAIKSGKLGAAPIHQYQIQYRNRSIDQLTDDDLLSILGDQLALDLLKKHKDSKK